MKHVLAQCSLAAVLLTAMAVPLVGNGAKAADRLNPGRTVQMPVVIADAFPIPWPCSGKSCPPVVSEMPVVIAEAFPTPWPCSGKSCPPVVSEMPVVIAGITPFPWPTGPGGLVLG